MIKKEKKRKKNSNSCHVEEILMYPHKSYLMSTFGMDETVLSYQQDFQIQKKYKFRLQKYISINTNEDRRRNHGEQSSGRFW